MQGGDQTRPRHGDRHRQAAPLAQALRAGTAHDRGFVLIQLEPRHVLTAADGRAPGVENQPIEAVRLAIEGRTARSRAGIGDVAVDLGLAIVVQGA